MRSFSASFFSVRDPTIIVDQATQALQVRGPRTRCARRCGDGRFRQCRPSQSSWVEDLAEGHIQAAPAVPHDRRRSLDYFFFVFTAAGLATFCST